jgi:molybdopterin-binding protein
MNTLVATVTKIDTIDNLNIVNFNFSNQTLSMMSLDLSDDIKIGTKVKLITKPSYIAIAKEFSGILSYSNQLKAKIKEIENGKLLSSVKLQIEEFVLESIITFESSKKMDLKEGDEVTAFIKASELSILKVL